MSAAPIAPPVAPPVPHPVPPAPKPSLVSKLPRAAFVLYASTILATLAVTTYSKKHLGTLPEGGSRSRILTIDLSLLQLTESPPSPPPSPSNPLALLLNYLTPPPSAAKPSPLSLETFLHALALASLDDTIAGVHLKVPDVPDQTITTYTAHAIKQALGDFRRAKGAASAPVYTSATFPQTSQALYLLLTNTSTAATSATAPAAARTRFLHPMGTLPLSLLAPTVETFYLKGFLDKLGIKPEILRRGKYKSAASGPMQHSPTAADITSVRYWMSDLHNTLYHTAGLAPATTAAALESTCHRAYKADVSGLIDDEMGRKVDHVPFQLYAQKVKNKPLPMETEKPVVSALDLGMAKVQDVFDGMFPDLSTLHKATRSRPLSRVTALTCPKIAVVRVLDGIDTKTADEIAERLYAYRDDPNVAGVVLRVQSPGGDPVAADTIRNAVLRCKEKKEVVCSMGSLAASAGYYVSAPCSKIYASPVTLTGSIGVFGGKVSVASLLSDKLGVNVAVVSTSEDATFLRPWAQFTKKQKDLQQKHIDQIYDVFKNVVSNDRGIPREVVDEIAEGRVYTGKQAVKVGLVDAIGDLEDAVNDVRRKTGLQHAELTYFPTPKSKVEKLTEKLEGAVGGMEGGMELLRAVKSGMWGQGGVGGGVGEQTK